MPDVSKRGFILGLGAVAASAPKYVVDTETLTVGTADPLDLFRQILVVTRADIDWLNFHELASEWKRSRRNTSAFGSDPRDPNYLRIIGMGPRAIPCILRQLRSEMLAGEPDHWFTALWAITGKNPIPEESQGKIREMALAWLACDAESNTTGCAMTAVQMTSVESSNISAIGYDAAARALTVQFKDGAKHRYADVPPEKHAGLMGDGSPGHSVGKYFHAHIKGAHKSSKVED